MTSREEAVPGLATHWLNAPGFLAACMVTPAVLDARRDPCPWHVVGTTVPVGRDVFEASHVDSRHAVTGT